MTNVQLTYDRIAEEYAKRIFDELAHKPLDCQLLDRFAERVKPLGPACDLGCGPGHVARYLAERGLEVCGVDLSPSMVEIARRLNPHLPFRQGDMLRLDLEDGSWAGVVAMYSIIHIPRPQIPAALREIKRVLRPEGWLLLGFHAGTDTIHLDEWWGIPVSIDAYFLQPQEITACLESAGFTVHEVIEREPYPEVEYQSRRAYIFAQSPYHSSRSSNG